MKSPIRTLEEEIKKGQIADHKRAIEILKTNEATNDLLLFYKRTTYYLLLEKSDKELADYELDLMYNLSIDKDIQEFLKN